MSKYTCPECNKSFKNRSSKSLCMRRHNNKDLVFQCPNCPRIYKDPSSLRKHKRLYEHNKDTTQDCELRKPSLNNSESVIIPMNLSLHVNHTPHISENLVKIVPKIPFHQSIPLLLIILLLTAV